MVYGLEPEELPYAGVCVAPAWGCESMQGVVVGLLNNGQALSPSRMPGRRTYDRVSSVTVELKVEPFLGVVATPSKGLPSNRTITLMYVWS